MYRHFGNTHVRQPFLKGTRRAQVRCAYVRDGLILNGKHGKVQFIPPTWVLAEVCSSLRNPFQELNPKKKLICRAEQITITSRSRHLRIHLDYHDHLLLGKYLLSGVRSLELIYGIVRRIWDM